MPAGQVREIILREFGVRRLEDIFEWIDLEAPLGSASLAQVGLSLSSLSRSPSPSFPSALSFRFPVTSSPLPPSLPFPSSESNSRAGHCSVMPPMAGA